ncbi:hypothetical protein BLX87_23650 [Bacillus sp. VT-16-64]|nr:hypothetical protein BLX87_23650 [Bacillus sp. VT-16-64]
MPTNGTIVANYSGEIALIPFAIFLLFGLRARLASLVQAQLGKKGIGSCFQTLKGATGID